MATQRDDVRIAVTPVFKKGQNTVCEIGALAGGSQHVKDGLIRLKQNKSYKLSFEIQQPAGAPAVNFKQNGNQAFSCDANSCPTNGSGSSGGFLSNPQVQQGQKVLTVDADTGAGKDLMFYRLNFDDGSVYDPIVIHD